jgi:hypothetical protein
LRAFALGRRGDGGGLLPEDGFGLGAAPAFFLRFDFGTARRASRMMK